MPLTLEQKRAAILISVALAITLVLAGLVLFLLRDSDEPAPLPTVDISAAQQNDLEEQATKFVTVTGNYGLKPEVLNAKNYLTYMKNSSQLALLGEDNPAVKTSLTTFNELGTDFFASDSKFLTDEDQYYSLYLLAELKTVRAENVEAITPAEGFERSGVTHVNVEVKFDSTETIRVKTGAGPDWDGIVEIRERNTNETVTLTYKLEAAGWRLLDIDGVENPASISLLNEDVDSNYDKYNVVDSWDTGQRPIPDDHTLENTVKDFSQSTEGR